MSIKPYSPNKVICSLLFALCYLFFSCEEPADTDNGGYNNPNAGTSRDLKFSHDSGLYSQSFKLSITAPVGSTIYYSTDGSIPSPAKVDNKVVFKYTSSITIQNRNGQANVLATAANSRQLYGEPGDRGNNMPSVYTPSNDQVPKATVIRAIAVDAKGIQSGVLTKTYFIGNNLANYGSSRIISLVSDPYNLIDQNYGIMVRGNPANRWEDGPDVYNFQKKGQEWERETFLELFEGSANSRSVKLSTGVGIRVRGGWSRAMGQKSFTVYFREEYGINNLRNYNLIPGAVKADGTPVERYKSFMLRNGANDGDYTKFYDVFIQDLLSDRSFSAQAGVPCVVYLNGEYWGPYNLQERYSDNHTEYKYGVAKENVISYDNGELDDGNPGDDDLYYWPMMNMKDLDMSVQTNYNEFCALFDIDNFIDYWAAQIYIYNEDWPQNNYRLWRTRTVEPGNPYGDTKWRWQMFDTEFAMGIYNGGGTTGQSGIDAIGKILEHNGYHQNNQLFKALLANEAFCRKLVNTMMDLYNVNFHPDSFTPKLNNYASIYRPLMGDNNTSGTYFSRWGGWSGQFQNKVNEARNYLTNIRDMMVNNYLPKYFGGYSGIANIGISRNNLRDLTISATGLSGASIKINTVTPNLASGSWTGKYYSGNSVTVTASAPDSGYEFDGWTVSGGSAVTPSALTTTVNITGNVQITAKYKQVGVAVIPATGITLNRTTLNLDNGITTFNLTAAVTPSNATYKTVSWESSDYSVANVDSGGKVSAVRSGTAVITASTVNGIQAICTVTVEYNPVLLDLAAAIQHLQVQTINDWDTFYSVFDGIPVGSAWPGEGVTYAIINEGGVKKIQVNEHAMWGPGLDITPSFIFQAGDIIEIKGTHLSGSYSNGIQIQKEFVSPWSAFYGWGVSPGQGFQETFTLSSEDADWFNANIARDGTAMRIRTNGKDPWASPGDANYQSGFIGSFVIEQFMVTRP